MDGKWQHHYSHDELKYLMRNVRLKGYNEGYNVLAKKEYKINAMD